MEYASQLDIFGGDNVVLHSVSDRVQFILRTRPETRANDNLLVWVYWFQFNHLGYLLQRAAESDATACELDAMFQKWLPGVTSAETITRRRREFNEVGELLPPKEVVKDRERKSKQGSGPFHR